MKTLRFKENPLITPENLTPSREDFEVVGVFNAGAIKFNNEILLLTRVAERPKQEKNYVKFPLLKHKGNSEIEIVSIKKDSSELDLHDPRLIFYKGECFLSSMSHFRIARSKDGHNFEIDKKPTIFPATRYETYGIEDPRITFIDEKYYITYTAISKNGVVVCLISTEDFKKFKRHGIIFCLENKDVAIFPEKCNCSGAIYGTNGKYVALHRPFPTLIGTPSMWIAYSDNLIHWGNHKCVMTTRKNMWDELRIGCGAVPFKTEKGWLEIYHGVDRNSRCCLGAALFDLNNPQELIARSKEPIFSPETDYETHGFFGNVVFTCGLICENHGMMKIYYGCSDEVICGVEIPVKDILVAID